MIRKVIGTHSGTFHCDEVLACCLLSRYTEEYVGSRIVRTRDPAVLETCDIMVDVGGRHQPPKYFDHHQKEFDKTELNSVRLSSAGLVWLHFKEAGDTLFSKVHAEKGHDFPKPSHFE